MYRPVIRQSRGASNKSKLSTSKHACACTCVCLSVCRCVYQCARICIHGKSLFYTYLRRVFFAYETRWRDLARVMAPSCARSAAAARFSCKSRLRNIQSTTSDVSQTCKGLSHALAFIRTMDRRTLSLSLSRGNYKVGKMRKHAFPRPARSPRLVCLLGLNVSCVALKCGDSKEEKHKEAILTLSMMHRCPHQECAALLRGVRKRLERDTHETRKRRIDA